MQSSWRTFKGNSPRAASGPHEWVIKSGKRDDVNFNPRLRNENIFIYFPSTERLVKWGNKESASNGLGQSSINILIMNKIGAIYQLIACARRLWGLRSRIVIGSFCPICERFSVPLRAVNEWCRSLGRRSVNIIDVSEAHRHAISALWCGRQCLALARSRTKASIRSPRPLPVGSCTQRSSSRPVVVDKIIARK